jgi:D-3-phosphoglycerate dehydrogenase / 2-oxoglutarate reductase
MKPICLIYETKDFSQSVLTDLEKIFEVKSNEKIQENQLHRVEVLYVRLSYYIGSDLLQKLKNLRYICSPTTGLNHIDLDFCKKNKIEILSLRNERSFLEENITATSEYTWALFLSIWRKIPQNYNDVREGNWRRDRFKSYQLKGGRVGILGFGRVGKKVAQYAKSFDMQIEYYDPYVDNLRGKRHTLEDILINNSIIFITCKYTDETKNLINKSNLHLLQRGSLIINTARGEIVNENDLISMIKLRDLKYASDVISNESSATLSNFNLLTSEEYQNNIFLTSHIAGACYDAMHITESRVTHMLKEKLCSME